MRSRTLLILGLAILLLSLPYFVLVLQAGIIDTMGASLCPDPCNSTSLAVEIPRRALNTQDSETITAVLTTNSPNAHPVGVGITAPGFATSPPETTRTVDVVPGQETRVSWEIRPSAQGPHSISVHAGD